MHPRLLSPLIRPCRFIARRRYPVVVVPAARRFHISRRWLATAPADPNGPADPAASDVSGEVPPAEAQAVNAEGGESTTPSSRSPARTSNGPSSPYGSAVRRAMRNRKPAREFMRPAATVPSWFYERNTVSNSGGQSSERQSPQQVGFGQPGSDVGETTTNNLASGGNDGNDGGASEPAGSEERYMLSPAVWEELLASVKAGLRLPAAKYVNEPAALKSHLVLQYPGNDGILFLDAVVKRLGQSLGANVVTLNAQDIAQLCSEQDMADTGMTSAIRSLGYDVYRPISNVSWQESDEANDVEGDDADIDIAARPSRQDLSAPKFIPVENPRDLAIIPMPNWLGLKALVSTLGVSAGDSSADRGGAKGAEHRWSQLLNELIAPVTPKDRPVSTETAPSTTETDVPESRQATQHPDVIIQIQDYRDIQATREGSKFITLLQSVIREKRKEGARVLLVGTVAREVFTPGGKDTSRFIQMSLDDNFSKTLVVTPAMDPDAVEKIFTEDRKRRTMEINIRHLQEMLRIRVDEQSISADDDVLTTWTWPLDDETVKKSGINERYWTYNHVHWVTTLALGCAEPEEKLGLRHIQRGIELMQRTDRIKNDWLQQRSPKPSQGEPEADREQSLKALRKTCNTHEKKLLNGVVDAKSIRTTFADVHVPPETIDALKTLTSLSLVRPEAFTYGVLATDKIPGLLLYGPPGTGKTLLAKAVARESGATVLEVSGSEVYDMYVGEGEKNVKAIFTLAKKLSPCVVFIDEADAIFCSRTGASTRTSHRELINQFLREWDGMNDMSAFIMVATNRPFDLDDAVLRRLPRRLLVDLPTEKDREAILRIHLKEEVLDPAVDLAELARRTPLYSGSDLKNLCVAAALACVREENDLAAQHQGPEPYQYPERRVLQLKHFERGMEEISASVNEDMSSLSAIRKFDEKYGDRKGRRKKGPSWGFTPPGEAQTSADTARVRT
ncbi:hypothetical protein DTO169E5_652 [Paecilomyces variotii]|nr:hypothetical protein DTO169E5_652 [Paecilomyces variotii]KAJ9265545.1 hypothetical protein DTO195F2_1584 [Paecilomyces variotii]KAJ9374124.1 hypothetical protein DTO282E5_1046 [Paecilomyces variotii]